MVSKSKEEKRRNLSQFIRLNLFWLCFFGMFAGFSMFFIGSHNVDICHNGIVLNERYDLNLVETDQDGNFWQLDDCYRFGFKQQLVGFWITFVFGVAFGSGLIESFKLRDH